MSCLSSTSEVVLPENEQAAKVWNSAGEYYDCISRQIADAIEHCVDRLAPMANERILDVATGTGWTARRIAARGAQVTGIDISSAALQTARALDASRQISFQLGDAEALQLDSSSYDAVCSTFGVMFCNAPDRAARELARVCRRGGRLALAIWDTRGGVYDMFQIINQFKPQGPVSAPSPFAWAAVDRLQALLGNWFELQTERAVSYYRERNGEAAWTTFSTAYGPLKSLLGHLNDHQAAQLREAFIAYHQTHATDMGILVPRDYLIVTGIRK